VRVETADWVSTVMSSANAVPATAIRPARRTCLAFMMKISPWKWLVFGREAPDDPFMRAASVMQI
jgi:hypothetical protein